MKTFITVLASFFGSMIMALYLGFVGIHLWDWFVFPSFGILAPSLWAFVGISLMVRLITYAPPLPNEHNETDTLTITIYSLVVSFLLSTSTFITGWIFHFWI